MDAIRTLLEHLAHRGVRVWREGDHLVVEPASALAPGDRELIAAAKPQLLERLLTADDQAVIGRVMDAFPGATHAGISPRGTFRGPMLPLRDGPRCPVCTNTKHRRRAADSHEVCAICAEGGPAEIIGSRFLAALLPRGDG
jgi:hypothetical protein